MILERIEGDAAAIMNLVIPEHCAGPRQTIDPGHLMPAAARDAKHLMPAARDANDRTQRQALPNSPRGACGAGGRAAILKRRHAPTQRGSDKAAAWPR